MRARPPARIAGFGIVLRALVVRGVLTVDLDFGRRYRPLGPLRFAIGAPRRALRSKLEVLRRGQDDVLAAHHTRA